MKAMITFFEMKMLRLKKFIKKEDGAEGIEWSTVLIVAVPIIAIIVAIGALFAEEIGNIFDYFSNFFSDGGVGDVIGGMTSGAETSGGLLPPG